MLKVGKQLIASAASAGPEELAILLQGAARLEHATIPPYLTAAYSLKLGINNPIRDTLKRIAVEEMLHMAIIGNLINAIGGTPQFDDEDFLPVYPAPLPLTIGEGLVVGLRSFSLELVRDIFMIIEEPEVPLDFPNVTEFATIGEFYRTVIDRIATLGPSVFTGDPARQVIDESGFGPPALFAIVDPRTATEALEWIINEGEGTTTQPTDNENELAHYYRFREIVVGRKLVRDAGPDGWAYAGEPILFDHGGVHAFQPDAHMSDFNPGSSEYNAVEAFNLHYCDMLRQIQAAYGGRPALMRDAIRSMRTLRRSAADLTRIPHPAGGTLSPTFEFVPQSAAADRFQQGAK